MNIVIVALDFKPNPGGIAEYTYQLAEQLHQAGDQITILSRNGLNVDTFDARSPFHILRHDWEDLRARGISGYLLRYRLIEQAVRHFNADLLLCNTVQSETEVSNIVANHHKIPLATFAYGREITKLLQLSAFPFKTRARRWLELQFGLRKADHVFCISQYTRNLVVQLGVDDSKISLIPPGISLNTFSRANDQTVSRLASQLAIQNRPVILSVARLVPRKGIDVTLRALPEVVERYPDLIYVIAGKGTYGNALMELTRNLGIQRNVHFAGYISEEEKKALYELANLFVMPNREEGHGEVEGFGIVFLEANFFGKPVIGGCSGGAAEAVIHGETGLLVSPEDPSAVASAILTLLENEELARRLGRQGQRRVVNEMNYQQIGRLFRKELFALMTSGEETERVG